MRQGIIFGLILIVLSFGGIFYQITNTDTSGFRQVELIVEGEELYSSPLDTYTSAIIWYVKDSSGEQIILEDQEIISYYGLVNRVSDLTDPSIVDFDKITAKSGEDIELNMILISQGEVSIYEANCQDKVCVKTGSIDGVNQQIACLPHKLVLQITGEQSEGDKDA